MEEGPKKDNFLAMSILIAAFVIGGSFIYGAGVNGTPDENKGANVADILGEAPKGVTPTIDDDVILGDPNAPVTVIEFSDYQCPFCKKLFDETETVIRTKYIETGKVKMVLRDFPLEQIHPFARAASEAAECAKDQGRYWEYHDALFAKQSLMTGDAAFFSGIAKELGFNVKEFDSCVSTRKYKDEVDKDIQDGIAAGVQGTPATFINGKLVSGAVPVSVFESEIEAALAAVK